MVRRFLISFVLGAFFISCKSNIANKPGVNKDESIIKLDTIPAEKLSAADIENYKTRLENLFDSNLIFRNFNGGIIIAKGGNILYERYTGFTNPQKRDQAINDTTAFHLASTSKPFTGVTILKLIQQGKIRLDDDVIKYFPEFPYQGITVKDLLSHRSGLPNYLYVMEDKQKWPADKKVSNEDVLNFLVQYQPALNYKPNTHFSYCNTNFVLLALIIEKVTGTSYPQYLKETIFQPLGMAHTFVYTPANEGKVLLSYKTSGALWEEDIFDNTYGDKNIYSTPRDMLKWDAALYNNNFIRQSLLDSAFQPESLEKPSIHNYGLGWRMLNLPNGKKVIYHNGKWHGFNPAFARLLDEHAVIIILGNQHNNNIYQSAKLAYNIFGDYLQSQPEPEEEPAQTEIVPVDKKNINEPVKGKKNIAQVSNPSKAKAKPIQKTVKLTVPKAVVTKKNIKAPVKKANTATTKKKKN